MSKAATIDDLTYEDLVEIAQYIEMACPPKGDGLTVKGEPDKRCREDGKTKSSQKKQKATEEERQKALGNGVNIEIDKERLLTDEKYLEEQKKLFNEEKDDFNSRARFLREYLKENPSISEKDEFLYKLGMDRDRLQYKLDMINESEDEIKSNKQKAADAEREAARKAEQDKKNERENKIKQDNEELAKVGDIVSDRDEVIKVQKQYENMLMNSGPIRIDKYGFPKYSDEIGKFGNIYSGKVGGDENENAYIFVPHKHIMLLTKEDRKVFDNLSLEQKKNILDNSDTSNRKRQQGVFEYTDEKGQRRRIRIQNEYSHVKDDLYIHSSFVFDWDYDR
jgi:hypothetical protein